jgi:hypothetical protein
LPSTLVSDHNATASPRPSIATLGGESGVPRPRAAIVRGAGQAPLSDRATMTPRAEPASPNGVPCGLQPQAVIAPSTLAARRNCESKPSVTAHADGNPFAPDGRWFGAVGLVARAWSRSPAHGRLGLAPHHIPASVLASSVITVASMEKSQSHRFRSHAGSAAWAARLPTRDHFCSGPAARQSGSRLPTAAGATLRQ